MLRILVTLCVLAAAAPTFAALNTPDIGGRWQGTNYRMAALSPDCVNGGCEMTLDIAPCGDGWCGIEVTKDATCGATALKISNLADPTSGGVSFDGELQLAEATEPYVIKAFVETPAEGEGPARLHMTGDTGGEFRIWRRSFPFQATLSRIGEAHCKAEKSVS